MQEEVWKDIAGYEGKYQVSNLGRVRSLLSGRSVVLSQNAGRNGYMYVHVYGKTYLVHRLVALAFLPNLHNKRCVDHINCNRSDNCVKNLRWVTHSENNANAITRRRMVDSAKCRVASAENRENISKALKGKRILEESPSAVCVLQLNQDGSLVKKWDCIKSISVQLGYCENYIRMVLSGSRRSAYGFLWKYADGKSHKIKTNNKSNKKRSVIMMDESGVGIKFFDSILSASKNTGVSKEQISKCCNEKCLRAGGYKWKFSDK